MVHLQPETLSRAYSAAMTVRRLLKLGGPDPTAARAIRRALVISGSVKTLPVAVTVLTQLGAALGEGAVGIAMLPVVAYQLIQIMWESVMVSRWLAADNAQLLRGRRLQ